MTGHFSNSEQWLDKESGSSWERDPATSLFKLVSFHEKKVNSRWKGSDIVKALNCRYSESPDDGAQDSGLVPFPPRFKYSPNTGEPLKEQETKVHTWLPVSGSEDLTSGLLRGGRLTSHPLKLERDDLLNKDQIPLPDQGRFRFCVGAFGLSSSFLLALDGEKGAIYCWLPASREWFKLEPAAETSYLGTTLSPDDWNIDMTNISGESIIYWPSDLGLVAIKIDVLSLKYEAKLLIEGCCLSVPRILGDKVYILIKKADETVDAISVDSDWQSEGRPCKLSIMDIPPAQWVVAVATLHEIIYLSNTGQVVLRPRAEKYLYIPWQEGVEPQFLLGGPYCSNDGDLWMQCLHPTINEGEEGFCYIKLGQQNHNKEKAKGARMLTGKSSFKLEEWLKGDPWVEPAVVKNMGYKNNKAVIPILESTIDNTLLVLNVEHKDSITQLFERVDDHLTTQFQIMGLDGNKEFFVKNLRKPWTVSAFIFDEALFIYHSDIDSLPGWLTHSPEKK